MNASWIDVTAADGGTFQAYLSLPPVVGGPGIVLIQEIFGVNEHIRAVADQYAADGYTVLAPDLFWRFEPRISLGYSGAALEKGRELRQRMDLAASVQDLATTAAALRRRAECGGKLAAVGYCVGGLLAYLSAAAANVDVAVCYYGGGIHTQLDKASKISCPIQLHFGEKDGLIPMTAVDAIRTAFGHRAGVSIHTYADADHGFNCWARGSYRQRAAALAHGRTLEFLAEVL